MKNPVLHDRTKHFKIKFHAIRQLQLEGEVEIDFCSTEDQVADIFTKSLPRNRFIRLRGMLGMQNLAPRGSVEIHAFEGEEVAAGIKLSTGL